VTLGSFKEAEFHGNVERRPSRCLGSLRQVDVAWLSRGVNLAPGDWSLSHVEIGRRMVVRRNALWGHFAAELHWNSRPPRPSHQTGLA
jgi:hypothetical protein